MKSDAEKSVTGSGEAPKSTELQPSTVSSAIHRYSPLSQKEAQQEVEIQGPTEALHWAQKEYSVVVKAIRDPDWEEELR